MKPLCRASRATNKGYLSDSKVKEGLPSIVVGGNKRYDKEKVIKWLEERG